MPTSTASDRPSVGQLINAPHRLMFFVGASNVLLAMAWWAAWLIAARWPDVLPMPQPQPPIQAGWLHAFIMQYLVLPSFMFGFLLTVFPRWMGLPDLKQRDYVPVGVGLMGGQLAILFSTLGLKAGLVVGLLMVVAGWSWGLFLLGRLLFAEPGKTWHARSCYAALVLGYLGILGFLASVLTENVVLVFYSIKLGGMGLLFPIYITVAHRMFPFFAGNVVPGYKLWRPLSWLAAVWAFALLHLGLEMANAMRWLWLADVPLFGLTTYATWRWWPRGRMPGLLAVLFYGVAWIPLTFALYSAQSLILLASGEFVLGRAPAHALFIGFFGSLLVAMVTRVTQGHSGRPLIMPWAAWFAYIALQIVTVLRIASEVTTDAYLWYAIVAIGWIVALLPWVCRIGWIYLSPRVDGRPG